MSSKRESEDERFERLGYERVLDEHGEPTNWWLGPDGDLATDWLPRTADKPVLDLVAAGPVFDSREPNDGGNLVKFRYLFAAGDDAKRRRAARFDSQCSEPRHV